MKTSKTISIIVIIILFSTPAFCQGIPKIMEYAGQLASPAGTPLPSGRTYTVRFNIVDPIDNVLWEEEHGIEITARNKQAAYKIVLGETNAIDLPFNEDYRIRVFNITRPPGYLIEEKPMTSVGYAYRAEYCNNPYVDANGNVGIGTTAPAAKLHVIGNLLGAAKDTAGNSLRIVCGRTTPGATNWVQYNMDSVYVHVDTSIAEFSSTPFYFTSLGGRTHHFGTLGATSIYGASATGFRIYLIDRNGYITPQQANNDEWHINWCAIGN